MKRSSYCFRCGAPTTLSNCDPPTDLCDDCGQCSCLRAYPDYEVSEGDDEAKFKIGDGVHTWKELPWFKGSKIDPWNK